MKTRKPRKKIKVDIRDAGNKKSHLKGLAQSEFDDANELVPDLIKATDEYDAFLAGWDGKCRADDHQIPNNWYVSDALISFLRKLDRTIEEVELVSHDSYGALTPGVQERVTWVLDNLKQCYVAIESDIKVINAASKAVNFMSSEEV